MNKRFTWTIGMLLVTGLIGMGMVVVKGSEAVGRRAGSTCRLGCFWPDDAGAKAAQLQPAQNDAAQLWATTVAWSIWRQR
ncbi:MAG: hypothetical protein R2932_01050 [Caldilineaceae bacterium]